MPQFDIFRNPGQRAAIPFVVSLQSTRLERAAGRLVIPLVEASAFAAEEHWLTPRLTVAGRRLVANPFDLATVPLARLGAPVGRIEDEADRAALLRAVDELLSQA
ncbi:CcdB cytotoxin-like protein [Pseudoroseomonas deserti]|uniref:Toxin CcdB n=1 Tax=Teichococcus deserti TaxID=1817963 RepID=A0A1V2H3C9_9PROT|nr:CcdB family protein [Pseudoroseomonas deserti]ONG54063.1 CcdB cytotoxin-like protein [Pseudoroseomonas deserti]